MRIEKMQEEMSYKERQMYLCKTQNMGYVGKFPLTLGLRCDKIILLRAVWGLLFLMRRGIFYEDSGQRLPAGQEL